MADPVLAPQTLADPVIPAHPVATAGAPIDPEFLQSIAVFGGLCGMSLERLTGLLRRRLLPPGACVVSEGECAREMFVVEHGEVEVLVREKPSAAAPAAPPTELVLAVLRRGACFGEMALLDIQPRSATVRTREETSILVLGYRDMVEIQRADAEAFLMLVMNIAREVSRRLRLSNRLLASVLLSLHKETLLAPEVFGGPGAAPR